MNEQFIQIKTEFINEICWFIKLKTILNHMQKKLHLNMQTKRNLCTQNSCPIRFTQGSSQSQLNKNLSMSYSA